MKNVKAIILLFLFGGIIMIPISTAKSITSFIDGTSNKSQTLLTNNTKQFNATSFVKDVKLSIKRFNFTNSNITSITNFQTGFFYNFTNNISILANNLPNEEVQMDMVIDQWSIGNGTHFLVTSFSGTSIANDIGWSNRLDSPTCNQSNFNRNNLYLDPTSASKYFCINTTNDEPEGRTVLVTIDASPTNNIFNFTWKWYGLPLSEINFTILANDLINYTNISEDVGGNTTITLNNTLFSRDLQNITFKVNNSLIIRYFSINITLNDIPNATNVSITELPITAGNILKGHANVSDLDNDTLGGNQTYWWVNKTLINDANNSFTLLGGNVTDNANITFSARFNDTYDWSDWKNSSIVNVGDSTAPVLNNCTLSSTSITDASGNTINLTCDATDVRSNIQTMVASMNGTINKTLTFSFAQAQNVIATRIIFQSEETLLVGAYSINQVNVTDTSLNKLSNTTKDLHFTVTSAPSGGGTTGGGGGGGGLQTIIVEKNETIITGQCNFNKKCEPRFGEDSFNCNVNAGGDCEFKFEEIFPTCLVDKNQQCIWRTAIVGRILLIAVIISFLILISDTQQGRKVRKVLKERLNINLLKE